MHAHIYVYIPFIYICIYAYKLCIIKSRRVHRRPAVRHIITSLTNKQTRYLLAADLIQRKSLFFFFLSVLFLLLLLLFPSLSLFLFHVRLLRLRRLFRLRSRRRTAAKNRPRTLDELITVFALRLSFFSPLSYPNTFVFPSFSFSRRGLRAILLFSRAKKRKRRRRTSPTSYVDRLRALVALVSAAAGTIRVRRGHALGPIAVRVW